MAVPLAVTHIWSEDGKELSEGQITITKMIEDELNRLETQGTKEYYDRPTGSGAIPAMTATYPNPLTTDQQCEDYNTKEPQLKWTVVRNDKVISKQCVFFNGEALTGADGLENDVSSGESNVDSRDCSGSGGEQECPYEFHLKDHYKVVSYPNGNSWPADRRTIVVSACPAGPGCDLGPVPTAQNYELSFTMATSSSWTPAAGGCVLQVTGANMWYSERYPLVLFNKDGKLHVGQTAALGNSMNDWEQNHVNSQKVFAAGQTYAVRVTNVNNKLSLYVDDILEGSVQGDSTYAPGTGGRLMVGWDGGGRNYAPASVTLSNARFSAIEVLNISKQSYCFEQCRNPRHRRVAPQ